jgi:hypothetical protein
VTGEATLLGPDAADWGEALTQAAHDVYHLPEYVVMDAPLSGGLRRRSGTTSRAGCCSCRSWCARYRIPGMRDAASPCGYPGLVSNAGLNSGDVRSIS